MQPVMLSFASVRPVIALYTPCLPPSLRHSLNLRNHINACRSQPAAFDLLLAAAQPHPLQCLGLPPTWSLGRPGTTLQPSGAARHVVSTPTACSTAALSPDSRTKNMLPARARQFTRVSRCQGFVGWTAAGAAA